MTERLLQYIWQFQYYNHRELATIDGVPLRIIEPGRFNTNQGPDFLNAAIKIGNIQFVGSIELHLNGADWIRHGHQADPLYNNVVLHVVWETGPESRLPHFPTLVLEDRIPALLLRQYEQWMQQEVFVPCGQSAKFPPSLLWDAWQERLLAERIGRKTAAILQLVEKNRFHWEESSWQLLARNFGTPLNGDAFEAIARSLPLVLLARHRNQLIVLESLLLGQAGLLDKDFTERYERLLAREYRFLRHKYRLISPAMQLKFLRMRPAHFPSLRLVQLAAFLYQSVHLIDALKEAESLLHIKKLLDVTANDHWHYHYRPGDRVSEYRVKNLGKQMLEHILINAIVPLTFAYGEYHRDSKMKDKAMNWLSSFPPEKNHVISGWRQLGIRPKNAAATQALIELKSKYCDAKRCLDCAVGNWLLKRTSDGAQLAQL